MINLKNLLSTIVRKNGHPKYIVDREYMRDFQRFLALRNKTKVEQNNVVDLRPKQD